MIEVIYNADGTTFQREIEAPEGIDKEVYINEMFELKTWFDTYYKEHFEKYIRLIALGKLTDEQTDPQIKLTQLYETAETNRIRIQELENLLKQ